jgi:catechol-2,3-dioxygenase
MITPKRLAHLVLRVRDINCSEKFYTDVLGLKVTSREMGMVFMSARNRPSHELALAPTRTVTPAPEIGCVGLSHFAWEMNSFEELKKIYEHLKEQRVNITGIGDHGISLGVYFQDPDGNKVEVFYELPKEQWPTDGLFHGKFPLSLEEDGGP